MNLLKLGKMYTAESVYNIFILKNASIDRLEIGDPDSKWHNIDSRILYGEYTRKVCKTFGNIELGNLYKDTIKKAKTIDAPEQMDMGLEDGVYCEEYLKLSSEEAYYGFVKKKGRLYSEVCLYDGVKIILYVSDAECNIDLEPLNFPLYKRVKKLEEIPDVAWKRHYDRAYDNCLFMAAIFRKFFIGYVNSIVNIDSPDVLREVLYDVLKIPVLYRDHNGDASVETDAIRKLARMKRDVPVNIITSDMRDGRGRLALTAARLNSAKYPAVVYLEKYRHYKELAIKFKPKTEGGWLWI
jgi:hypothetical protein